MTSKEALTILREEKLYLSNANTNEVLNTIEKDLQLLEILRVFWSRVGRVNFNKDYYQYLLNYGTNYANSALPKEVYDLIKEWLENDE